MEEPQTNIVSEVTPVTPFKEESTPVTTFEEESTPVTIFEGESTSVTTFEEESTMDQQQTTMESADPSASCESETEADSENQLRVFVTLLTVRVLTKCHALQNRSQEEWVTHTKRLVNQTMVGLTLSEDFCPDNKTTKKVCKAVIKDLTKKFCGRRVLESLILIENPAVDTAIIESLQAHIKELSARQATKATSRPLWKDILQSVGIIVGSLVTIALMLIIV